jgi:hypothetical protein
MHGNDRVPCESGSARMDNELPAGVAYVKKT